MPKGNIPAEEVTAETRVEHLLEARDLQPDVCMRYPKEADERRREAAWISAKGPSFVDLLKYR